MGQLALAALGRDRPGIVESVTGVLLDHGANIEDSQMTILRGRFTMVLIVEGEDRPQLRAALEDVAAGLGLDALTLDSLDPATDGHDEPSHVVTIYGADHPGIVHGAAHALTSTGCNVTDLKTRVGLDEPRGAEGPLYVVMLEAAVPAGNLARVEAAFETVAREQRVEISVNELSHDEL